jgi:xanthine/uracil/vitamin C permease (AzgA family)
MNTKQKVTALITAIASYATLFALIAVGSDWLDSLSYMEAKALTGAIMIAITISILYGLILNSNKWIWKRK